MKSYWISVAPKYDDLGSLQEEERTQRDTLREAM